MNIFRMKNMYRMLNLILVIIRNYILIFSAKQLNEEIWLVEFFLNILVKTPALLVLINFGYLILFRSWLINEW